MPKKTTTFEDKQIELLQKILIVELARSGVAQNTINKIVGVSTSTVNNIAKYVKKKE